MATVPIKSFPRKEESDHLKQRFRELASEWDEATAHLSSMNEASEHPAYQEIIRLGPAVVPLLLQDMEANHTHWFMALRALTQSDPIPQSAAGNIPKMVRAWVDWGKANGYQW